MATSAKYAAAGAAIQVEVRTSEEVMRHAVTLPHGWGHDNADGLKIAPLRRVPEPEPSCC